MFVFVGSKAIGVGSSRDKALSRALSHSVDDDAVNKVIPLSGCSVTAVPEHKGRKHVMAIAVPRSSSGSVTDFIFSFDDPAARDSFIQQLQVSVCVLNCMKHTKFN